ncbi:MerC domain-containing protein [Phenylobacterium sp. J426]|uniref:MerC domain-containing protein n=1 Tax=Phenylobacterium sp. J426 TaxID=2898439 RepID=UPI002150C78B|nr:MerC domain-containing protein [Phenylobacterium sp. J426]MCR5876242.1 MerC domain-containing protein [Phenylobacterium sp. J426]
MRQAASVLDGAALGLSSLCLAHCLALPVLATALPLLGAWAEAEWVHALFVMIAAPLAATALLRPGHGLKPSAGLLAMGFLGLALLAFGALGPAAHERTATLLGALLVAAAHVLNWRRRLLHAASQPTCAAD